MSVGDNVNHEVNGKVSIKTSLGTLHAEVVGEQGEYPGISVELEKADGSRGFVSLTEVCDGDLHLRRAHPTSDQLLRRRP